VDARIRASATAAPPRIERGNVCAITDSRSVWDATVERKPVMTKAAVIVLADTETHGDLARVVNAMMTAKEFTEAGDDVELMFDGAGTQWPGVLADPDHRSHRLFEQVHEVISGACAFCSRSFDAEDGVRRADVPFLEEYKGHPSVRRLVQEGREVLTF
jgi:hypothetical protein